MNGMKFHMMVKISYTEDKLMGSKRSRNKDHQQNKGKAAYTRFEVEDFPTEWGDAHTHLYIRNTELIGIRVCVPDGMPEDEAGKLNNEMHDEAHQVIAKGSGMAADGSVTSCICKQKYEGESLLFQGSTWPLEFSGTMVGMANMVSESREFCGDFGIKSHIPDWPSQWG